MGFPMNEPPGLRVVLARAAALLAVSLAAPASAQDRPPQSSGQTAQGAATEVPAPKARPVRKKRVASAVRRARPAPGPYLYFFRPPGRFAARWAVVFFCGVFL